MKSFIPFIVIAICVAMYYMYISPTVNDVKALSAKKAQYTDILQKSKELKDRRDALLVQYNAISPSDIDRLKKIVPATLDSVDTILNLNTLAGTYGMTVTNVKIGDLGGTSHVVADQNPQESDPYKIATVSFSVTGQYNQFISFLRDLESNTRLFDVTGISIKVNDAKPGTVAALQYTVDTRTYYLQ